MASPAITERADNGSQTDSAGGASTTTANFTPTDGTNVIAVISHNNGLFGGYTAPTTPTGTFSTTWSQVLLARYAATTWGHAVYISSVVSGSPTNVNIQFNFGGSQANYAWWVGECTNQNSILPVRNVPADAEGNSTTPAITLASFASADNGAFSLVTTLAGTSFTAGTGWTELADRDIGEVFAAHTFFCQWRADNDISADATQGSAEWLMSAFELNTVKLVRTLAILGVGA